ncbi:hypothetical protein B0H67DRAFT_571735 [Lasiosphaeris hirsuta]|uniref:Uncharacterized protein n=1 Tax=Lasiosphaeris hirsuta TaxID=260670 RepID=A0AA40B1H6_9PEZI|nr:hypothetical protein B0H67DRAFT_571735 [Lasiosphaeris hirsuta]
MGSGRLAPLSSPNPSQSHGDHRPPLASPVIPNSSAGLSRLHPSRNNLRTLPSPTRMFPSPPSSAASSSDERYQPPKIPGVPFSWSIIEQLQPNVADLSVREFSVRACAGHYVGNLVAYAEGIEFPDPNTTPKKVRKWIINILRMYGTAWFDLSYENIPQRPVMAFTGENGMKELIETVEMGSRDQTPERVYAIASTIRSCIFIQAYKMMGAEWGTRTRVSETETKLVLHLPEAMTPDFASEDPSSQLQYDDVSTEDSSTVKLYVGFWRLLNLRRARHRFRHTSGLRGPGKGGDMWKGVKKALKLQKPPRGVYVDRTGHFMLFKEGKAEDFDIAAAKKEGEKNAPHSIDTFLLRKRAMTRELPEDRNIVVWLPTLY